MKLSDYEKTAFSKLGIINLEQAADQRTTKRSREWVLSELDRLQIVSRKSANLRSLPVFQLTTRLGEMVKMNSSMSELFSNDLLARIEALLSRHGNSVRKLEPFDCLCEISVDSSSKELFAIDLGTEVD